MGDGDAGRGARPERWAARDAGSVSLENLLGGAPLPVAHVLGILRVLARDLDALAAAGLAYGALSPSTVLVDAAGEAALVPPDEIDGLRPGYLAPEQRHADALDARLDQYALGIIAYELLSGERRESAGEHAERLGLVNEIRLGPEHALRPGLAPAVNETIRQAIARDPSWRFASATAFVDELARQLAMPTPVTSVDAQVLDQVAAARLARAARESGRGPTGPSPASRVLGLSTYGVVLLAALAALTWLLLSATGQTVGRLQPGASGSPSAVGELARRIGVGAGGGAAATTGTTQSAAPAARGYVTVGLTGVASADVVIDGEPAGRAPGVIAVATGLHLVEVRAPGRTFVPPVSTITVTAGDTSSATFRAQ